MDMRMALVLLLNRQGIENLECRTLECWNMALNLMEPLAKPAIGKNFPSLLSLKFRRLSGWGYTLLHCQAVFWAESLACVQIILQIMTSCQQKIRVIVRNNKKQVQ